ncbi:hypothetical protein FHS15_002343 [Paenibacillus castaneae]|uniref:hypothetical protein n=1 Tax=Paenibacillus castaneae TaxID=474957 RepID=UPI00141B2936|nr:hypothetical protein [Paenibacillus castaneae]NIK77218.1 hypothetical protein [Paenibacillus castaneae]
MTSCLPSFYYGKKTDHFTMNQFKHISPHNVSFSINGMDGDTVYACKEDFW